jgi:hypothetical protein
MSKQTAVEWLVKQLLANGDIRWRGTAIHDLAEQAKAMERDQIIDAYTECWMMDGGNGNHKLKEANEYFDETYGGDK